MFFIRTFEKEKIVILKIWLRTDTDYRRTESS